MKKDKTLKDTRTFEIVDIHGNHILWVKAKIINKLVKKGKLS